MLVRGSCGGGAANAGCGLAASKPNSPQLSGLLWCLHRASKADRASSRQTAHQPSPWTARAASTSTMAERMVAKSKQGSRCRSRRTRHVAPLRLHSMARCSTAQNCCLLACLPILFSYTGAETEHLGNPVGHAQEQQSNCGRQAVARRSPQPLLTGPFWSKPPVPGWCRRVLFRLGCWMRQSVEADNEHRAP